MGSRKAPARLLFRLLCLALVLVPLGFSDLAAQTLRVTRVPVAMRTQLALAYTPEYLEGVVVPGLSGVWTACKAAYRFPGDGTGMEVWCMLSAELPVADASWVWSLSIPDPRSPGGGRKPPVRIGLRDDGGYTLAYLPVLFGPDIRSPSPWWYVFRFRSFDAAALDLVQQVPAAQAALQSRDTRLAEADFLPQKVGRAMARGFFPPNLGTWLPD